MSPKLCIKYFSKPIYDLKTCSKMKKTKFFNISMFKTTQKSKKVEIGFVTPFDHCAMAVCHVYSLLLLSWKLAHTISYRPINLFINHLGRKLIC